jgi:tetratricopeptide (TPR) repeat protein
MLRLASTFLWIAITLTACSRGRDSGGGAGSSGPRDAPASARERDDRAREIFQAAERAKGRADLEKQLTRIEAQLASGKPAPMDHYAHGWILANLGRRKEAVTAYQRAVALDPKFADAHYNLGVQLAALDKTGEAIAAWEAAIRADPKHVDAHYNAGQAHYNRKEFAKALSKWQGARRIAPKDFDILKKVVQAENALGRHREARASFAELEKLWSASADPKVKKLTEAVIDQFEVDGHAVMAYQRLAPLGNTLDYVYTCRVTKKGEEKPRFSVQIESSAYGRETGTPYLAGVTRAAGGHSTKNRAYKTLPTWEAWKTEAVALIREELRR